MEGGVEVLRQHRGRHRPSESQQHAEEDESESIRRRGLLRGNRGVQDPELFALLALLHVLCELGILIPLQQRGVELPGRLEAP